GAIAIWPRKPGNNHDLPECGPQGRDRRDQPTRFAGLLADRGWRGGSRGEQAVALARPTVGKTRHAELPFRIPFCRVFPITDLAISEIVVTLEFASRFGPRRAHRAETPLLRALTRSLPCPPRSILGSR